MQHEAPTTRALGGGGLVMAAPHTSPFRLHGCAQELVFRARRGLDAGDSGADVGRLPAMTLGDLRENLAVSVEDLAVSVEGAHDRPLRRLDPADGILNAPPMVGSHLMMDRLQGILERVESGAKASRDRLKLRGRLSVYSLSPRLPDLLAGELGVRLSLFAAPMETGEDARGGDEAPQRGPGGAHHRREFPWAHSDVPPSVPVTWSMVWPPGVTAPTQSRIEAPLILTAARTW